MAVIKFILAEIKRWAAAKVAAPLPSTGSFLP
jgi:hypothetical protein